MKKLKICIKEIKELSPLVVLVITDSNIKIILNKIELENNFTFKSKNKKEK